MSCVKTPYLLEAHHDLSHGRPTHQAIYDACQTIAGAF